MRPRCHRRRAGRRSGGPSQGVDGLFDGVEEVVGAEQFEDRTTPEVAVDEV